MATNTSSLSVTEIAAGTPFPSRVVGMHFFNPVPVMKLVEVVTGVQTDPQVADTVAEIAVAWGKQVARVRSAPGFIVNRVARGFYGEALRLVEEQVAPPATIDEVMRAAGQFRMGPFELMDLIGNDVNAAVTRSVWTAFNFDPRFEPSRIQDELVAAGRYGRKRGQGFYSYDEGAGPERPVGVARRDVPVSATLNGSSAPARVVSDAQRRGRRAIRGHGDVTLGDGTLLRITRGRTARDESRALGGTPVVVIDRTVTPDDTTAIAAAASHPRALGAVAALLGQGGITVHEVADAPGLVVARTLAVIANEAWETALHGVATPADIDVAMQLGTNYPVRSVRVDPPLGGRRSARDHRRPLVDLPRHEVPGEPRPPRCRDRLTSSASQRVEDVARRDPSRRRRASGAVVAEEERVLHAGVPSGHGALEHDHVVGVPNREDGHAGDRAARDRRVAAGFTVSFAPMTRTTAVS